MVRRFGGLKPRDYEFVNPHDSRKVIALFAGGKPIAFIEYPDAYEFVNTIHDLAEAHERKEQP